ncbi:hypothetical protein [Streptomyces sp. NBC_00829]|uniref:hypothetical protein n=1 Tax=Streptomyces sp. NBC_00829 TaxID=2903679 RepID=UPI003864D596|nr:hypothetical protein OG293_12075 [Streptomyces sp. NBC_00829]
MRWWRPVVCPRWAGRSGKICQAVSGSCGVGQGTDGGVQAADSADDHPALPVARAGDDAFAYQVTGDFEGVPVPLVFQP